MSRNLKTEPRGVWEKSVPGRRNSECKGPEAATWGAPVRKAKRRGRGKRGEVRAKREPDRLALSHCQNSECQPGTQDNQFLIKWHSAFTKKQHIINKENLTCMLIWKKIPHSIFDKKNHCSRLTYALSFTSVDTEAQSDHVACSPKGRPGATTLRVLCFSLAPAAPGQVGCFEGSRFPAWCFPWPLQPWEVSKETKGHH